MKTKILLIVAVIVAMLALTSTVFAGKPVCDEGDTTTAGFCNDKYDQDNNGIPDAGVKVTGAYTALYAEDINGDYYWDLGDGRIYKTVASIADLDQTTLTVCDYHNQYRADFGNDPYMDSGWIINNINCSGYEPGTVTYLIVHETDPRYTGNPELSIWGTWEFHVNAQSGLGNVANLTRPERP